MRPAPPMPRVLPPLLLGQRRANVSRCRSGAGATAVEEVHCRLGEVDQGGLADLGQVVWEGGAEVQLPHPRQLVDDGSENGYPFLCRKFPPHGFDEGPDKGSDSDSGSSHDGNGGRRENVVTQKKNLVTREVPQELKWSEDEERLHRQSARTEKSVGDTRTGGDAEEAGKLTEE